MSVKITKSCNVPYRDTEELMDFIANIHAQVLAGEYSNTTARVHIGLAKIVIDALKVEIAAKALGVELEPLRIGKPHAKGM